MAQWFVVFQGPPVGKDGAEEFGAAGAGRDVEDLADYFVVLF